MTLQSIPHQQQQCSISVTLQKYFSHPSLVIYFLLLLLLLFSFANPTHKTKTGIANPKTLNPPFQ
jgi:hypothetical protein